MLASHGQPSAGSSAPASLLLLLLLREKLMRSADGDGDQSRSCDAITDISHAAATHIKFQLYTRLCHIFIKIMIILLMNAESYSVSVLGVL